MRSRRLALATCGALAIAAAVGAGCRPASERVQALPAYTAPRLTANLKVPYPILLLHGLGQKADVWSDEAVAYFANDLGLTFGGDLNPAVSGREARVRPGDYYTVHFSSPFGAVDEWAEQIATAVRDVREATGARRVVLLGYSMGGLAGRAYLTARVDSHHVKRLVTVGTPHLGSPFARVWTWHQSLSVCAGEAKGLSAALCGPALRGLLALQDDIPFDAPAVRDLRRPEDGGTYLEALNRRVHPLDVEYVSIVGEISLFDEAAQMRAAAFVEPLRRFLSLNGGPDELLQPGDGIVSAQSQDVTSVEFFRSDASRRRAARTVRVGSVHVDHLRQTVEVQRLGLDDKPDVHGAALFRRGREAVLAVDFVDPIPSQCKVTVEVVTPGAAAVSVSPEAPPALIVTADGLVARSVVPLADTGPSTGTGRQQLRVVVRNSFGYTAERTVEW